MITLRFVAHKGLFTWLCRLAQYGAPYTHCEVLTPEGKYLGAMLLGGVQARDRDYDGGVFAQQAFVNVRATAVQAAGFFAFLRDQLGKPFDPVGIIYFFGPFSSRNWRDPGAWWCSELIAAALEHAGIIPDNAVVPACRVTPRDLFWLANMLTAVDDA